MELGRRNDLDGLDWVFLGLTLVLAGIHLYLGVVAPAVTGARAVQFALVAAAFLAGALVYATAYWRPILYLPGIGFALYLGWLWVFGGREYFLFGVVTGLVATAFVLLAFYLFFDEASSPERA